MIHKATELVKFKKLHRRLGFTKKRETIGLLESLWHLTLREALQGDIGKLDDETIAIELEWDGDPAALVQSLVETRWLERSEPHRLIVHDWHNHAPDYLKGNLKSHNKTFATCSEQPAIATCSEQPALSEGHTRQDKTRHSISSLQSSESEELQKIREQIPDEFLNTTAEPIRFADADGSEASVFEKISRVETLSDPEAIYSWWRYQLGCRKPVLGREAMWCVVALALGLKFANSKKRINSRVGMWSSAIGRGYWSQAGPFIPRAIELLRPIIFPEVPNDAQT